VNNHLTEILTDFGKVLVLSSEMADLKPGKRFIPPLKIADVMKMLESSEAV